MIENNERPTHLDLFTGIGGFTIAAKWAGFRTLAFCEIDPFCRRVLAKHWPHIINFSDIKKLNGTIFRGVDLITGGFPCQPFSVAGKRRGTADDRSIWPEMFRVIKEARPAWVVGENVVGILDMELDQVLSGLESIGYATRAFIIPACAVDAQHKRERIWIVANSNSRDGARAKRAILTQKGGMAAGNWTQYGSTKQPCRTGSKERTESELGHALLGNTAIAGLSDGSGTPMGKSGQVQSQPKRPSCAQGGLPDVSDAAGQRSQGQRPCGEQEPRAHERPPLSLRDSGDQAVWEAEPRVGRVADGIPGRSHRLRSLGNAIVPQCAYPILRAINEQIFLQNEKNLNRRKAKLKCYSK
jgi:DNA (cytosine-5)-methyltransferase 1